MLKHKEYSSTWTKENPPFKKFRCTYRTLPLPLPERQVGVACAALKVEYERRGRRRLSLKHMPLSKMQHKYKSFTEAQYERDFELHGTSAALLDKQAIFLTS